LSAPLGLALTLRVLAHSGQYLSDLPRHNLHLPRHNLQLTRHLRVIRSHRDLQICNSLPYVTDWHNPPTRYKCRRGKLTGVFSDAGVGDSDHQISDLVIPV
jgi:hypothetical protein